MRRIGEKMHAQGYDIELHHCSSDNNSLDGVVIPALGIALMDGTAPHIVDPKNPGCVDEIIHLGDFWQQDNLVKNKEHILSCNKEITKYFHHAYRMLHGAKSLYDDWKSIHLDALHTADCNQKTISLTKEIFKNIVPSGTGKLRKLFASAITPDGHLNYIASITQDIPQQYLITGEPGSGKSLLVTTILNHALLLGLDVEAYYCPFDPLKPEHLVIPAIGVAIITASFPHLYENPSAKMIDMNPCIDLDATASYRNEIDYARTTYLELFHKGVHYIHCAKKLHDQLETYYVPNMDFIGIEKLWIKTLDRILKYTKQ